MSVSNMLHFIFTSKKMDLTSPLTCAVNMILIWMGVIQYAIYIYSVYICISALFMKIINVVQNIYSYIFYSMFMHFDFFHEMHSLGDCYMSSFSQTNLIPYYYIIIIIVFLCISVMFCFFWGGVLS